MNTNRVWVIEEPLLHIYFLLTHRIKGLGWSLKDFWEVDTWTTSMFYLKELDLIDEEDKKFNENKNRPEDKNDPEVDELYKEMFGDE